MEELGYTAQDYTMAVFHQPNVKFPQRAGKALGFKPEQIRDGLLVDRIGNTYAGSSLIGLTSALDVARPGDHILVVSFGSGAGSDAFSLIVTDSIEEKRCAARLTAQYVAQRQEIDYATYVRYRRKLHMH
jgi:hydroxymethylglutaryl-CoA synthase